MVLSAYARRRRVTTPTTSEVPPYFCAVLRRRRPSRLGRRRRRRPPATAAAVFPRSLRSGADGRGAAARVPAREPFRLVAGAGAGGGGAADASHGRAARGRARRRGRLAVVVEDARDDRRSRACASTAADDASLPRARCRRRDRVRRASTGSGRGHGRRGGRFRPLDARRTSRLARRRAAAQRPTSSARARFRRAASRPKTAHKPPSSTRCGMRRVPPRTPATTTRAAKEDADERPRRRRARQRVEIPTPTLRVAARRIDATCAAADVQEGGLTIAREVPTTLTRLRRRRIEHWRAGESSASARLPLRPPLVPTRRGEEQRTVPHAAAAAVNAPALWRSKSRARCPVPARFFDRRRKRSA